jgi:hypothetical protein
VCWEVSNPELQAQERTGNSKLSRKDSNRTPKNAQQEPQAGPVAVGWVYQREEAKKKMGKALRNLESKGICWEERSTPSLALA